MSQLTIERTNCVKLAWATDIHLNFLTAPALRRFLESVKDQADAPVVTDSTNHHPN